MTPTQTPSAAPSADEMGPETYAPPPARDARGGLTPEQRRRLAEIRARRAGIETRDPTPWRGAWNADVGGLVTDANNSAVVQTLDGPLTAFLASAPSDIDFFLALVETMATTEAAPTAAPARPCACDGELWRRVDEEHPGVCAVCGGALAARAAGAGVVERLQGIIERERTAAVTWIERARAEVRKRRLISQSRGPYEWDDEAYFREFGAALDAIDKALDRAERETGARDLTDCPTKQADVDAARASLATPPSPRAGAEEPPDSPIVAKAHNGAEAPDFAEWDAALTEHEKACRAFEAGPFAHENHETWRANRERRNTARSALLRLRDRERAARTPEAPGA